MGLGFRVLGHKGSGSGVLGHQGSGCKRTLNPKPQTLNPKLETSASQEAPSVEGSSVAGLSIDGGFRKWGFFFGVPFKGILFYLGYKRGTPYLGNA